MLGGEGNTATRGQVAHDGFMRTRGAMGLSPAIGWNDDDGIDLLSLRPAWHKDGACTEHDPNWWFPTKGDPGKGMEKAQQVCAGCLVKQECYMDAVMASGQLKGIRAGYSENQMKVERRKYTTQRSAVVAAEKARKAAKKTAMGHAAETVFSHTGSKLRKRRARGWCQQCIADHHAWCQGCPCTLCIKAQAKQKAG